jgi:hypothetical protein
MDVARKWGERFTKKFDWRDASESAGGFFHGLVSVGFFRKREDPAKIASCTAEVRGASGLEPVKK